MFGLTAVFKTEKQYEIVSSFVHSPLNQIHALTQVCLVIIERRPVTKISFQSMSEPHNV